jgi:alanyl-tRNA synthetase
VGSLFDVDTVMNITNKVSEITGAYYGKDHKTDVSLRVITDHIRSSVFMISDGILPSNECRGYVLRRLMRRAARHGKLLNVNEAFLWKIVDTVVHENECQYPELREKENYIISVIRHEEENFNRTIDAGMAIFKDLLEDHKAKGENVFSGADAFRLYDTFGFPLELTQELGAENGFTVDVEGFKEAERKHQEASKSLDAGKAKGGLAEQSDTTTKYHTATHLLQQALVNVLGDQVAQKGSNINNERMRFDFTFERPMTKEEIQKVEDIVNEKIKEDLPVTMEIMSLEAAKAEGARALFTNKYGEDVKVYTIGKDPKKDWFSKEVCGGPHVQHTAQIGDFKIQKEQSSSAGVRRIRAVISGGLPLED